MPRPLDGIRVIDLSLGPVGGLATTVLADFGADVIKVERPGGDPLRRLAAWPLWLRGKRSIELDLREPAAREHLLPLTDSADAVVTSLAPGKAEKLGIDQATLTARNPALVYCSITGFGPRGPYAHYPGYEGVVAAKSGRFSVFAGQRPREGPGYGAVQVGTHAAAQGAVQGIVAALLDRERTGRGGRVETSLLQAMLPYDLWSVAMVQLGARDPERFARLPGIGGGMPTLNYHPVMCRDGRWIQLGNLLEHLFYAFLDATGLMPELLADERFGGPQESWSRDAIEEARDRILRRMLERDADEWMEIFRSNGGIAAETWQTTQEALYQRDLVANGDVIEQQHPRLGTVRQVGLIAQLCETPGAVGTPAPAAGQHSGEVLAEARRGPCVARGASARAVRGSPLSGITILELGTIIATPLGASLLADLGARVIKVEAIGGDPFRHMAPGPTRGLLASKTNAGKESICVDLKTAQGRAILRDLVLAANALIHNFRPGVPERLGVGYEQLREIRPDLVWVSANGYGPDCPSAHRPSTHPVPGASMGGAHYQAGEGMPPSECSSLEEVREASRQLMRANEANPDPNTSAVIASATVLALLAQRRYGIGQRVYVNMMAANAWANADDLLSYPGKPSRPPVDAELLGVAATYRLYRASEGWVFLAIVSDEEWSVFCTACGRADLAREERFATRAERRAHDGDLAASLEALFRERDADSWEKLLVSEGVGCVRADAVSPGSFFAFDAHSIENGFAPLAHHARFGELRRWGPLVVCDGGMDRYAPGPLAGEHTDRLLSELGRSPGEIARLREERVVWSEPVDPDMVST